MPKTKKVIIEVGEFAGEEAYVTWESARECLVRVTPVEGDPLASLELRYNEVRFVE